MFTWVCPTCGKELDLGVKECPDCQGRAAAKPLGPEVEQLSGPEAPAAGGIRFWLLLGAGTLVAVVALVTFVRYRSNRPPPEAGPKVVLEGPAAPQALPPPQATEAKAESMPAAVGAARDLEFAGIRMSYDSQNKPQVRALVTNHGEEPVDNASFTVTLRPAQSAADAPPLARFTVKIAALKAGEYREIKAPLDAFGTLASMPPWRRIRADVEAR